LIRIRPWATNKLAIRFVEELEDRLREVGRGMAHESAASVLEHIRSKLPRGEYRDSLELVEVGKGTYAIRASGGGKKVSEVDSSSTILYVRPKTRRVLRLSPEIGVLARFSPWTMDTLPFFPDRRKATVVSRKVRRSELDHVIEDRKRDEPVWKSELQALGIRPEVELVVGPKARVLPDVAFEALRMEFGLGGKDSVAHWRPALRALATRGIPRMLSRRSQIMRPVSSYRYTPGSSPVDGVITESEADKFEAFQKRLRPKFR